MELTWGIRSPEWARFKARFAVGRRPDETGEGPSAPPRSIVCTPHGIIRGTAFRGSLAVRRSGIVRRYLADRTRKHSQEPGTDPCPRLAGKFLVRQPRPAFRLGHPEGFVGRFKPCELSAQFGPRMKFQLTDHEHPLLKINYRAKLTADTASTAIALRAIVRTGSDKCSRRRRRGLGGGVAPPACSDQLKDSSTPHATVAIAIAIFLALICFMAFRCCLPQI